MKKIISAFLVLALAILLIGCRQADRVTHNISKEADNFNIVRRITIINMRSDKCIMRMTATCSLKVDSDGDLNVICLLPDGTYQKHFIHLNEWTTYVVEDISGAKVSEYSYELEFMPEALQIVRITNNDSRVIESFTGNGAVEPEIEVTKGETDED